MKCWQLAIVCLVVPGALSAAAPPPAHIGQIKAQLFYEATGRLSKDLLAQPDLSLWNVIITGSVEEMANDLLVTVDVTTKGQQNLVTPLRITATGAKGRVIADRRFTGMLSSEAGHVWKAMLLRDIGCEGRVTITVSLGKERKTRQLDFHCGE